MTIADMKTCEASDTTRTSDLYPKPWRVTDDSEKKVYNKLVIDWRNCIVVDANDIPVAIAQSMRAADDTVEAANNYRDWQKTAYGSQILFIISLLINLIVINYIFWTR